MEEFERLILEVESKGFAAADKSLDALEKKAATAESAVQDLTEATEAHTKAATADATKTAVEATAMSEVAAATAAATSAKAASTAATAAASAATVANTSATAADTAATAANTAAEAANTAAEAAGTAATAANTAATAANTVSLRARVAALASEATAWMTSRAAIIGASAATAAATVRTAAATAATAVWTTVSRGAAGAMGLLTAAASSLWVKLAALAVPIAAFTMLVGATRKFQDFQAQLKTATGSVESATEAYGALQRFASTTPYSLDEATSSFIKLVNYGLTPSERALRSFGNTASAMGKSMMEYIEAVADAATGEMERLKEFGIKASKNRDEITFTFRGVKTTVQNTAKDIEEYLTKLGENNFATSMSDKMSTLGGAISNLGDAWDQFLVSLTKETGIGKLIEEMTREAVAALEDLNGYLASGQAAAELDAWRIKWSLVFNDINNGLEWLSGQFKEATTLWGLLGDTSSETFQEGWNNFPNMLRSSIGYGMAEVWLFIEKTKIWSGAVADYWKIAFNLFVEYGKSAVAGIIDIFQTLVNFADKAASLFVAPFQIEFDRLVGYASASGQAIKEALSGSIPEIGSKFAAVNQRATQAYTGLTAKVKDLQKAGSDVLELPTRIAGRFEAAGQEAANSVNLLLPPLQQALDEAEAVRDAVQEQIATEYNDNKTAVEQRMAEAEALRKKFEDMKNAPSGEDPLAKFSKAAPEGDASATGGAAGGKASAAAVQRELEQRMTFLTEGLQAEEEVLASSYERRKEAILATSSLTEEEKEAAIMATLLQSFLTEEEALVESYNRRRDIILSNTQLTEEQKTELMTRLTSQREKAMAAIDQKSQKSRLDAASTFFGNLASIGSAFGEKGFKLAKAAAIAQATINTYQAATGAYSSLASIPYVGPFLGAAAAAAAIAAGVANIAQIKSQSYSGAYEYGGMIPSGKWGIVGEAGPEIVRGPANVTSAKTTPSVLGAAAGGGSVIIHNYGPPVVAESKSSGDDLLVVLRPMLQQTKKEIKGEIATEFRQGGGEISRAAENAYGLGRGRA
jgi:hypothetical protein